MARMTRADAARISEENSALRGQVSDALIAMEEAQSRVDALMSADNRGWTQLGTDLTVPAHIRTEKMKEAVLAAASDPLIKRGLAVREGYVWADGVQITMDDDAATGQDVMGIAVAPFLKANRAFAGVVGQIAMERDLGTCGEVWLALVTGEKTGVVNVRRIPAVEVTDIITDPEDAATPWFVARTYSDTKARVVRTLYPVLGYDPAVRLDTVDTSRDQFADVQFAALDGVQIRWDSPVRPVLVNVVGERGLGDAFASLPWSMAYSKFLEAWHRLMQSLARYAWQAKTAKGDKASTVAARLAATVDGTGQTVTVGPGEHLEAIGKSGATFDAGSAQPLLAMVSAGLGIPSTILSSDPGTTGARAVAETLDTPTTNEFRLRRAVWTEVIQDVIGWVIRSAVMAGKLAGNKDTGELPDGDSGTVAVTWAPLDQDSIKDTIDAIVKAHGTDTIPDITVARMILEALGVTDIDAVLSAVMDDDGNFVAPSTTRDRVAGLAADRGM